MPMFVSLGSSCAVVVPLTVVVGPMLSLPGVCPASGVVNMIVSPLVSAEITITETTGEEERERDRDEERIN